MERAQVFKASNNKSVSVTQLLKNKRFLCLWGATISSSFAFAIYLITETWYVINGLNVDSKLGLVLMMTTIPRVLLMAFGGVTADRINRSTIIFLSNTLRGVMVVALALIVFYNWGSVGLLLIFAMIFGVLDAFFWPASNSLMPIIVEKQQLVRANSIMQTTNQFSFMIGPVIAGALIKFGSFEVSFGAAGVMLLISGITIIFMNDKSDKKRAAAKQSSFVQDLKEGISYVRKFPYLLTVMMTSIFVNFLLVGPMNTGLPLLVEGKLKGDVVDLSMLEGSLAIGMIGAALLTSFLNFKRKRNIISLVLIAALGIFNGILSQMTALTICMIILLLAGACLSISNIISPSLIQEIVEPKMMGRVQSLISTASMGFVPLSYAAVSGLLSLGINISMIMLVSCLMMTLFVVIVLWRVKVVWTVD